MNYPVLYILLHTDFQNFFLNKIIVAMSLLPVKHYGCELIFLKHCIRHLSALSHTCHPSTLSLVGSLFNCCILVTNITQKTVVVRADTKVKVSLCRTPSRVSIK